MKIKHAFTLAEVLISLAILGIVVLLVITGIKGDQHEAQLYSTQYDKVYNDIFTASKSVLAIDRKNTLQFKSDENLRDVFQNRLDIVDTWEGSQGWVDNGSGVLSKLPDASIDTVSGVTMSNGVSLGFISGDNLTSDAKSKLASGGISGSGGQSASVSGAGNIVGAVLVDLNSISNPNKEADDQYIIPVYKDGIQDGVVPPVVPGGTVDVTDCASLSTSEYTCTGDKVGECVCACKDATLDFFEGKCTNCWNVLAQTYPNVLATLGMSDSLFVRNFDVAKCYECSPYAIARCNAQNVDGQVVGLDLSTCDCINCSAQCPNGKKGIVKADGTCDCVCDITASNCAGVFNEENCTCTCSDATQYFDYDTKTCATCVSPKQKKANDVCECEVTENSACKTGTYNLDDCACYCSAPFVSNAAVGAAAEPSCFA